MSTTTTAIPAATAAKPPYIILPGHRTYFGGKGSDGTYQKIINQLPPHENFISGCLGACYVMRHKRPAPRLNVGVDVNAEVVEMWRAASFPEESDFFFYNWDVVNYLDMISERFDTEKQQRTLIYLDPPYPLSARRSDRKRYANEMTDDQHSRLLDTILKMPNFLIAISSYPNDLYEHRLYDWRCIEWQSQTRRGPATEVLWMNYPEPKALHDYTYLGDDFREREAIKKRVGSLRRKIERLSDIERNFLLNSLK